MNEEIAEKLAQFPEALDPSYVTSSPNAAINLFEGNMDLLLESGQVVSAPGTVEWNWLPYPSIRFDLRGLDHLPDPSDSSEARLNVPALGLSCRVSVTSMGLDEDGGYYSGLLATPVIVGPSTECDQVVFHLPNFFSFIGELIRDERLRTWRGRLPLKSDAWELSLDGMKTVSELIKGLKHEGGFAFTHTGALTRTDGKRFSYREADDLLQAMYYFLSFTRGLWCGPVLAVGRLNGVDVWREWSHSGLTPWKNVESWFPRHDGPDTILKLGQAFRGFMARWEDGLWKDPIKHTIHWYVESNIGAGGIEGGIVLAQTALELLGWLYLVEDPTTRQFSATDFNKRIHSAGRIRQLLHALDIPVTIPSSLSNLLSETATLQSTDGPDTFVKLRNAVVHPKKSKRDMILQTSVPARMEARELGLWYVEMVLLHIFGYEGVYYQRFESGWPDQVRAKVPWS